MRVPLERTEASIEIKKSRFIAIALPTERLEDVRKNVSMIRSEHPAATHVVHAAVLGPSGDLFSSSDDKEPKNTAGRPALEVLKGSGVTNITVCIVRYFGGTLLGTGGLVKAYGDSVKAVLAVLPTEELVTKLRWSITLPYNAYTLVKRAFSAHGAVLESESFDTLVHVTVTVPEEGSRPLLDKLESIGNGKIAVMPGT